MNIKKLGLIVLTVLVLLMIGFYQYDLYRDRNHRFQYSEELRLYPKYSFTDEDKYEVIPPGQRVDILRIREGKGSQDVYVEVNHKMGWVSSLRSQFEVLDR